MPPHVSPPSLLGRGAMLAIFLVVLAGSLPAGTAGAQVVLRWNSLESPDRTLNFDSIRQVNGALTATAGYAYGRRYGAEAEYFGAPLGGDAYGTFDNVAAGEGDDLWYGLAVFLPSGFYTNQSANVSLLRWDNYPTYQAFADSGGITIRPDHRARLELRTGAGATRSLIGPFDIPEGTWVHLQVHQRLSAGIDALTEVYRDGRLVDRTTQPNSSGRNVDRIAYGIVDAQPQQPLRLYFDRATVSGHWVNPIWRRGSSPLPNGGSPQGPPPDESWELSFADEFGDGALDTTVWHDCYWWSSTTCSIPQNGELQLYSSDEAYVEDDILRLRARRRDSLGWNLQPYRFTSGLVMTGGRATGPPPGGTILEPPGFKFTYGFMEARMKVPKGKGFWPAFWALSADYDWPPEIDIVEILGHDSSTAHFHLHYDVNGVKRASGSKYHGADFSADWHTFAVDWQPGALVWYVDGVERWRHTGGGIPQEPLYLLLNLAVGGDWPGSPDDSTPFPSHLDVDYVRVWQRG